MLLFAAARLVEPLRAFGRGQEYAADVGGEQEVDVFDREPHRHLFGRDAGVGDNRIDRAERGLGGIIGGLGRCLVGDVHADGDRLPARRFDRGDLFGELVGAARGEHDLRPRSGERLRKARAEPRRRPGHQRDTPRQIELRLLGHHLPFLRLLRIGRD